MYHLRAEMLSRKRKASDSADPSVTEKSDEAPDLFTRHLAFVMEQTHRDQLKQPKRSRKVVNRDLPGLGNVKEYTGVAPIEPEWSESVSAASLGWNPKLVENFNAITGGALEADQQSLLDVIGRYVDIQALTNSKDHRTLYVAHALNHLLCTRNLIVGNKHKLDQKITAGTVTDDLVESLRDQGFARPTILILCPFKKDAYDIVERLKQLVFGPDGKADVWNKTRFETEFASEEVPEFKSDIDPELKELLTGNNDDCFRVGIALSKKTLKLYEPFDKADILLCSPLGLRMILDGEAGKESHLVSSIQMVIVDGADVMLQQNWEHLTLIFSHLFGQPSKINADISRVRQFYLDGDANLFAQLMLFSKYSHELFSGLMLGHSLNYRGLMVHQPHEEGTLDAIEIPLCQELHRFDVDDPSEQADARFKYFKDTLTSCLMPHTCIVVPSYYDFVRVRNHFKRAEESFVACHEYASEMKIRRARDMFYHERKSLMIVTERFHYFNRKRIRGVQQLIFYQLPSHPAFYAEFINMVQPKGTSRTKATLLYSKFDRIRLINTFGTEMAAGIVGSSKKVHAIVSE